MQIVVVGHVDHGKSTVIGRLLAETGSLPEGKLEQVKAHCERNAKPFEYAFLLDALKDEQSQGITIDAARVFFETEKRPYLILDAPGHIEFLKNMITGAAHAEAALLVIDANEGVRENSRRHGYMLGMLGVRQVAVLVNKMDLVDYKQEVFEQVSAEYTAFLASIGMEAVAMLPVSGMQGDNISSRAERMPWFEGLTVLQTLDSLKEAAPPTDQPFRMPVQGVYKFTRGGDDRRIVAGTVETGSLGVGDTVTFYPSGKTSRVHSIESFGREGLENIGAGEATGFTLEEQIYVGRGELATRTDEAPPQVSTRLRASLFWLGRDPMIPKREYVLKLGTARFPVRLEKIERIVNASNLESDEERAQIERHEVAECVLRLRRPLAFDLVDELPNTARFVIVDDHDIRGGGIVRESIADEQAGVRAQVLRRNRLWERSFVNARLRAERYSQKAALVVITGPKYGPRKEVAKSLEKRLFEDGRLAYYLAFGSLLHGVDADLGSHKEPATNAELMRRLGEVAHILLDAGMILIISAQQISQDEIDIIRTTVDPDLLELVWVGEECEQGVRHDLLLPSGSIEEAVEDIKTALGDKGTIFAPW